VKRPEEGGAHPVPLRTDVPPTRRNAGWALEGADAKVLATCPPRRKSVASVTQDDAYEFDAEKGFGWLLFAATMLGLAGVLSIIDGIMALSQSKFYVANAHYVFSGSGFARWFGIFAASLNLIAHFGAIQGYPFWSLIVITLDILVIYALAVYGGKPVD
jgi:hypothetical protein